LLGFGRRRGAIKIDNRTTNTLNPNPWEWEKTSQKYPTAEVPTKMPIPLKK
jgi:hypothetical protein